MQAEIVIQSLLSSLVQSINDVAKNRDDAKDFKYAELTGRLDTMRVVLQYIQQQLEAPDPEPEDEPKAGEEKTPPLKAKVTGKRSKGAKLVPVAAEPKTEEGPKK